MNTLTYYDIWCYKQLNFMIYMPIACQPISIPFCSDSGVTCSVKSTAKYNYYLDRLVAAEFSCQLQSQLSARIHSYTVKIVQNI